MITNSKIGSTYEDKASDVLRAHGYWSHIMKLSSAGQPVDIIAAKRKDSETFVYLLDVKHVRESVPSFTLSRIEPNQFVALDFAKNFANLDNLGFAIYFERTQDWYWLHYDLAFDLLKKGVKSVKLDVLPRFEEILK